MSYDVAVYTDVTAHEAVDGNDGFGFLDLTPELNNEKAHFIRDHMLHQVNPVWHGEDIAHPQTFRYIPESSGFFFSRGHSTGRTASGRPGNQLTEAIVSADRNDILPGVPAQVFGAENWDLSRSKGHEQWPAPLALREDFSIEGLFSWIKGSSEGARLAASYADLIELVERASVESGGRVCLIHDDIEVVMKAIAWISLLFSSDTALGWGINVYTDEPWQGDFKFVGLHPDMMPTDLSNLRVLNLVTGEIAAQDASEQSQQIAAALEADDPYDCLEAISLIRRWMPMSSATEGIGRIARRVTGLVAAPIEALEWEAAVEILVGLSSEAQFEFIDDFERVVQSMSPSDGHHFILLAKAVGRTQGSADHSISDLLLRTSLDGLQERPEFAGTWVAALCSESTADVPRIRNINIIVTTLLRILQGIPLRDWSTVLAFVRDSAVDISAMDMRPLYKAFAVWLSSNPDVMQHEHLRWLDYESICELTASQALARIDNDPTYRNESEDGRWAFIAELPWVRRGSQLETLLRTVSLSALRQLSPLDRICHIDSPYVNSEDAYFFLEDAQLPRDALLWSAWAHSHPLPDRYLQRLYREVYELTLPDYKLSFENDLRTWEEFFDKLSDTRVEISPNGRNVLSRIQAGLVRAERKPEARARALRSARYISEYDWVIVFQNQNTEHELPESLPLYKAWAAHYPVPAELVDVICDALESVVNATDRGRRRLFGLGASRLSRFNEVAGFLRETNPSPDSRAMILLEKYDQAMAE